MKLIKTVMHIMDKETGNLVLSQDVLNKDEPVIINYINKIIDKIEKVDYKEIIVEENSNIYLLKDLKNDFLDVSKNLASEFFESIKYNENIPGGDLLFFVFEDNRGQCFYGFIKLEFSIKFSHEIIYQDNVLINKIIRNKAILPSPTQKINEAIIVSGNKCKIIEKNYKGENKDWVLSKSFFGLKETSSTVKENIKLIKNAIENVSREYNNDVFTAFSETQKALHDSIEMDSTIDNEYLADVVFKDNHSAKLSYIEEIKSKGLDEVVQVPNRRIFEKKYKKQKIKLDNGIEITVPIDLLKDNNVLEFKSNSDGTTSILLKNIERLNNNFS